MPIDTAHDARSNVVHTRVSGSLGATDFLAYCERVLADPAVRPGFLEVLSVEPTAAFHLASGELLPFRGLWERYLEKGLRGTLVHAPSDHGYGVFRMFAAMIGAEAFDPHVRFEVHRDAGAVARRLAELRERARA
jgi:hypothetical protein